MQYFTNPNTVMLPSLDPTVEVLANGGLILYPTDSIWGIGCDATNAVAVERVFELKKRDRSNPFILLVSSIEMLKEYVTYVPPRVETLLAYHQRPLTFIYEIARNLPPISYSKNGSVAIRIPNDDFCKQLIERFGKPLISSSANIANEPFPKCFGEISSAVIIGVDHVVRHRQLDKEMGEPSVVARMGSDGELEFLRE